MQRIFIPVDNSVKENQALSAWTKFSGEDTAALKVDNLAGAKSKSQIYRFKSNKLRSCVIAKSTSVENLLKEQFVYEKLLPALPLSRLNCHGYYYDEINSRGWLFIEEAGGTPYDEEEVDHKALASKWLGTLHSHSAAFFPKSSSIIITFNDHFKNLHATLTTIDNYLSCHNLDKNDCKILESISVCLTGIIQRSNELNKIAALLPDCYFHGDFIQRNVQIDFSAPVAQVLAFDWERSGWGNPILDLAAIQPANYHQPSAVIKWPEPDILHTLSLVARFIRYAQWIKGTIVHLNPAWSGRTRWKLNYYREEMTRINELIK